MTPFSCAWVPRATMPPQAVRSHTSCIHTRSHMPAEIFTTPVAVTELVVNPADAHSWEMLGLGGLLTVERRGPDPDSIGVGGFEDAVCNVGRVSYVASSMSEEEASRPYRPMRRAPLPRTPSPSPGRRSPPRRRGAEAPTGRDDRDGWNGRDGREGRRVGGAQGHGVERARGLRIPGVGLGEDIIVGNRGQRGPGPAGAGGPVGRNVGRSFAVRKGYNLDQALERVPWKLREEVASYVEMDWLRWTIRCEVGREKDGREEGLEGVRCHMTCANTASSSGLVWGMRRKLTCMLAPKRGDKYGVVWAQDEWRGRAQGSETPASAAVLGICDRGAREQKGRCAARQGAGAFEEGRGGLV